MRKAIPFLIPLLLSAPMLQAQQKPPLAKNQVTALKPQPQQADPAALKMDPELLQMVKRERQQNNSGYVDLATVTATDGALRNKKDSAGSSAKTYDKVAVNITGKITPELVKTITNAGGVIINGSSEGSLLIADIPKASLQTIAESPYVKQVSLLQDQNTTAIKGQNVNPFAISKGRKDDKNIMSESVQKIRKQTQGVKLSVD